jgi:putative membrane fusion protein
MVEVKARAGDAMKMTGSFNANRTAVVSYYADGYEKVLSAKTMKSVTKSDMQSFPKESAPLRKDAVAAGDPVYKLTNNNEWYMVYWIKAARDTARYATGSAVTVSIGDASIEAEIYDASREGDDFKVTLRSDMYYESLTRVRRADVEVVFAKYSGLIIGKESIAVREGAPGVLVKQRSEGYKWVPVKILKDTGGKCTLAVDVYYDEAGKQVRTVNYFDEVLADPKAEGYE